jgi:hypothetical protein
MWSNTLSPYTLIHRAIQQFEERGFMHPIHHIKYALSPSRIAEKIPIIIESYFPSSDALNSHGLLDHYDFSSMLTNSLDYTFPQLYCAYQPRKSMSFC